TDGGVRVGRARDGARRPPPGPHAHRAGRGPGAPRAALLVGAQLLPAPGSRLDAARLLLDVRARLVLRAAQALLLPRLERWRGGAGDRLALPRRRRRARRRRGTAGATVGAARLRRRRPAARPRGPLPGELRARPRPAFARACAPPPRRRRART